MFNFDPTKNQTKPYKATGRTIRWKYLLQLIELKIAWILKDSMPSRVWSSWVIFYTFVHSSFRSWCCSSWSLGSFRGWRRGLRARRLPIRRWLREDLNPFACTTGNQLIFNTIFIIFDTLLRMSGMLQNANFVKRLLLVPEFSCKQIML